MFEIALSVARYGLGILVGAMVFFPSVVAPIVFPTVGEEASGRFLRRMFPRYYLFMIIVSAIATVALLLAGKTLLAAVVAIIPVSTLWVRQILVPKINAHRDAGLAGDADADNRFETGHKLSVMINMAQLLLAVVVMILIA